MRPALRWLRYQLNPSSGWPKYEKILLLSTTLGSLLLIVTGVYLLLRYRPVLGSEVAGAFLAGVIASPLLYLVLFGLVAVYVGDVFVSTRVRKDSRMRWAVLLGLGSLVVMPVYWYLFIWREPLAESASEPPVFNAPPDA